MGNCAQVSCDRGCGCRLVEGIDLLPEMCNVAIGLGKCMFGISNRVMMVDLPFPHASFYSDRVQPLIIIHLSSSISIYYSSFPVTNIPPQIHIFSLWAVERRIKSYLTSISMYLHMQLMILPYLPILDSPHRLSTRCSLSIGSVCWIVLLRS